MHHLQHHIVFFFQDHYCTVLVEHKERVVNAAWMPPCEFLPRAPRDSRIASDAVQGNAVVKGV
ncbi:hypothetical protein DNTS_013745 [Danionella cerebrum]|uniref:Uncharacterized protein n=1 Tax=Danionella cerebrum TaxID=2873325 RepID=A0A553R235_9TELE|nr:hypothetical protein DNTS_013745 [Danionella translucida]